VITALHKNVDLITPVKPATIAKSIAIGTPPTLHVLKAVRESGGWGEAATDQEIVEGIRLLARTRASSRSRRAGRPWRSPRSYRARAASRATSRS